MKPIFRLLALAILLPAALPLHAEEEVDLHIAYILDAIEARQTPCTAEQLAAHDGKRVVCAVYASSFSAFKTDWEIVMGHAKLPIPMHTPEPWTFRGGSYERHYGFEGDERQLWVGFAPDGDVVFAYVEEDVDPYTYDTRVRTTTLDLPEDDPPPKMAGFGGVSVPALIEDSRVEPLRSIEAQADRVVGKVTLEIVVASNGLVADVMVLKEEPQDYGFAHAVREAVLQWRFEPATFEGEFVPVVINRTVEVKQDPPPTSSE